VCFAGLGESEGTSEKGGLNEYSVAGRHQLQFYALMFTLFELN
jgi:hypothetical protein